MRLAAAAFGAGVSRREFSSYLPAVFVASVLCILAAFTALTIGRREPVAQAV